MPSIELLVSQSLDPFRIGLLLVLVLTASSTAGNLRPAIPLVLGIVFVAVLIPLTMQQHDSGVDRFAAVVGGLIVNSVVVGFVVAANAVRKRLGKTGGNS